MFILLKKHIEVLCLILDRCRKLLISWNLKKCIFFSPFGILLRHIIYKQGLLVDPSKIVVILVMPLPTSIRQLRAILGHIGYYKKIIKGHAYITTSVERLLKKDVQFQWIE